MQKMKKQIFVILMAGIAGVCFADNGLQIYLPREITVNSDSPILGNIAIIRGDEALVQKAESISMGHIASVGQKITIDKTVIISSLASNGIPASKVTFTGANEIIISQKHLTITGKQFTEKALSYLTENPPNQSVCKYNLVRTPDDVILSDVNENIKLNANLSGIINNQAKIAVSIVCGDKEVGSREVVFSLKYNCRKAIAAIDMPAGTVLSSENVKIEKFESSMPETANWGVPYGLATRKDLPMNSEIKMNMLENVKPQILLKRNQCVQIKVDRLGLLVTAIGRTMQDGSAGELIKVQNLSSQKIIVCKVKEDGSVEPVF
jgi:flagella basal body P-ring formation protein FlgA